MFPKNCSVNVLIVKTNLSSKNSFILANATNEPFSYPSHKEKQNIHSLHCGHIDTCCILIIADTQQKINVVAVDLMKVISH